jgi:nucleotide-binding universal stress UspA family protein
LFPKLAFKKILVAVDGSEVSMRAADHAARIAKQEGASLTAIYVIPAPQVEVPGEIADYYDKARTAASRWMKDVENIAASHGMTIKTEILVGAYSIPDMILAYADNQSTELIVTGTRGRTQSKKFLMGSVASALVQYANSSVLVVR